jgi:hypothetical protein
MSVPPMASLLQQVSSIILLVMKEGLPQPSLASLLVVDRSAMLEVEASDRLRLLQMTLCSRFPLQWTLAGLNNNPGLLLGLLPSIEFR